MLLLLENYEPVPVYGSKTNKVFGNSVWYSSATEKDNKMVDLVTDSESTTRAGAIDLSIVSISLTLLVGLTTL